MDVRPSIPTLVTLANDYGHWSVAKLKAELKNRNAKTSGNKTALVERLQAYDRNNNFVERNAPVLSSEQLQFKIPWPDEKMYRSVTDKSSLPDIDMIHINKHFLKVYKCGAGMNEYEAVHRKAYNMKEQFLFLHVPSGREFLRALTENKINGCYVYRGQVNSEMTKALTYFVYVAVKQEGIILQSQCECEAGAGPYAACKHVGVICYALLHFKEFGKWPIKLTVTQKPQQWHVPKNKKIAVSPMKAEQFTYAVEEYRKKKKKPNNLCFDPRDKSRPSTPFYDTLRNAAINYANTGQHPLWISGVFECASTAAFVHDHDYLKDPLDVQIIKNFTNVTVETAQSIEKKTREQSASKEWFWERSIRITASSVGEICHFTENRDKVKYAENLVNAKPTAAILWGKTHEPIAVKAYEKRTCINVIKCGFFVSPDYPFLGGSPDGLICELTVLEIKCPYSIREEKISPQNYPHIELKNGKLSLKRSSNYYYQCHLQMLVTKREFCDFFIWTTCDNVLIGVRRDPEVIQEILQKSQAYYNEYLLPQLRNKWFPLF